MKHRNLVSLVCLIIALTLVAACNKSGSSPTATAKAFYEAIKNKDVQGMKKTLSKGSLDALERVAQERGQSVDEILSKGPGESFPDTFEAKDETINGDTATLQVKSKGDKWETFSFIKENDQWKLTFDKR